MKIVSYLDWHVSHVRYEQIALPSSNIYSLINFTTVPGLKHKLVLAALGGLKFSMQHMN